MTGPTTGSAATLRAFARSSGPSLMWRGLLTAALVSGIGLLPWLSRTDPALTVLKARSAEGEPTPEALRIVRDQLGLGEGPVPLLGRWLGSVLRGDAGRSWVSGGEVLPSVVQTLGSSLLLMAGALTVATGTAGAVCARTLWVGSRRRLGARKPGGTGPAVLAALPEFLLASVLASVVGVQLGWLPALGWYGPQWMVLPSLALGLPAGAVLGRMLDDLLPGAFAEPWTLAAAARGIPPRSVARQTLRRCLPSVLPNLSLFMVGLSGGAVAVEQIFDIPGLGRLTLSAALAQDLPVLQTGALVLVLLAAITTGATRLAARTLIGPALRDGALHSLHRPAPPAPRTLPLLYGTALVAIVALGLPRDPLALETGARLQAPSFTYPFGTDALGRDILARIAHGALATLGAAVVVSAAALVVGVLLGLLPRLSEPLADTVNAVPPVLLALLLVGTMGSGPWTPALAVAVTAWSPLAAHASALLRQERATTHLTASRALGAGEGYLLVRRLIPAVLPSVARHALLRLPGVALALAALGFLGLGAQPPSPEWGLLIAENQPYAERAPWAVLAPAAVLALLGVLAVTAANGVRLPPFRRSSGKRPAAPSARPAERAEPVPEAARTTILTHLAD
ncbi:ABC transporter permease subunit [Streptomyces hydrogenans]|uniref:ABC transporter permease subunit n=1 Tax=Streptomyces hydrogenans TaxID=1873719 RepID=UPI0035D55EB8